MSVGIFGTPATYLSQQVLELQTPLDGAKVYHYYIQLIVFLWLFFFGWGNTFMGQRVWKQLREYKPYITNGIQSEYCENFLNMKALSPTVVKAFDFSSRGTRKPGDDDDLRSQMSVLWAHIIQGCSSLVLVNTEYICPNHHVNWFS